MTLSEQMRGKSHRKDAIVMKVHVLLLLTLFAWVGIAPLNAQQGSARLRAGAHVGANVSEETITDWRFGGQALFTVFDPVQISSGLNRYAGERDPSTGVTSGWQGWFNLRVSPLGRGWYIGAGFTVIHTAFTELPGPARVGFRRSREQTYVSPVILTGAEYPSDTVSPFFELHVLDLEARVHLFTGLNVRLF